MTDPILELLNFQCGSRSVVGPYRKQHDQTRTRLQTNSFSKEPFLEKIFTNSNNIQETVYACCPYTLNSYDIKMEYD